MAKARQLDFFTAKSARILSEHARRVEHGGAVRVGKRKLARPFDPRRALHLTLRAERAKGNWSMLRFENAKTIKTLTYKLARENRVRIYQYANSGNHLHLLMRAKDHGGFKRFLRILSALTARIVTGAKKGNPVGKFWDGLAWSSIVNWGRQFFEVRYYVIRNELEAEGLIRYKPRAKRRP
jgi:REP element-mobilizing transposase RayT